MKPTPEVIEAVITDMIELHGPGDPNAPYQPLWWVYTYDPEGNERGIGTDYSLAGALAAAWILSHDEIADRFGRVPLDTDDFDCVPRHVPRRMDVREICSPEGWSSVDPLDVGLSGWHQRQYTHCVLVLIGGTEIADAGRQRRTCRAGSPRQ